MIRVYVPATAADLDAWRLGERCEPSLAVAVTPELRSLLPGGDEEEYEHLATQIAAAGALADPIVVAALDVRPERVENVVAASGASAEGVTPAGLVTVAGGVGMRDVVCFLVANRGAVVTDDADLELSWYDASESDAVRGLFV